MNKEDFKPHNQENFDRFYETLRYHYQELFKTPEYAYAASKFTPEEMARKITIGLLKRMERELLEHAKFLASATPTKTFGSISVNPYTQAPLAPETRRGLVCG